MLATLMGMGGGSFLRSCLSQSISANQGWLRRARTPEGPAPRRCAGSSTSRFEMKSFTPGDIHECIVYRPSRMLL